MTRNEAIARVLGITVEDVENIDLCDLTDEDMDLIDELMNN